MGFSRAAVPARRTRSRTAIACSPSQRVRRDPHRSFGCEVPESLIHIDINPAALGRNYKAKVAIEGDSRVVVPKLARASRRSRLDRASGAARCPRQLAADRSVQAEWYAHDTDKVNPARFFDELRGSSPTTRSRWWTTAITPSSPPSSTRCARRGPSCRHRLQLHGLLRARRDRREAREPGQAGGRLVGDGAFLMTGLEILTATTRAPAVVVLRVL